MFRIVRQYFHACHKMRFHLWEQGHLNILMFWNALQCGRITLSLVFKNMHSKCSCQAQITFSNPFSPAFFSEPFGLFQISLKNENKAILIQSFRLTCLNGAQASIDEGNTCDQFQGDPQNFVYAKLDRAGRSRKLRQKWSTLSNQRLYCPSFTQLHL